MGTLLSEISKLVSTFNPFAVVDAIKKFNQTVDMQENQSVTFEFGTDDLYDTTDGNLTLQLFANASDSTSGGTLIPGKVITILAPATPKQIQGSIDILASELEEVAVGTDLRFVYGEIIANQATQLALVWGTAHAKDLRYGTARKNPLTGTTFIPVI